jgi:signal transduction histidine kinase
MEGPGNILVVDDDDLSRMIVRQVVEDRGYRVVEAKDGVEALDRVGTEVFDAIMLDVLMPRMDGFEVCTRLKEDPATETIPVLMITTLTDREDRLAGIRAGATDFIHKPIDGEEVLLRLRNAVHSKRLLDRERETSERLRALSAELEARNEELSCFAHTVAHDLKSPLSVVIAYLSVLKERFQHSPDQAEMIGATISSSHSMAGFITRVLELAEAGKEIGGMELVDIGSVAADLFDKIKPPDVDGVLKIAQGIPAVEVDPLRISQVLQNLMANAINYRDKTKEKIIISLEWEERPEDHLFRISDNGCGISEDHIGKIFNFGYAKKVGASRGGSGLGLSIAKRIVEAHGGRIWAKSQGRGQGTRFCFTLKKAPSYFEFAPACPGMTSE